MLLRIFFFSRKFSVVILNEIFYQRLMTLRQFYLTNGYEPNRHDHSKSERIKD